MAKTKYTNISSITYRYPIEYTEKNLKPLRLSFLFSLFWFSDGCVRKKHIIPANKNKDVAIGEKQPLKVCPDGTSCWMRSTCCRHRGGSYACCPLTGAKCCPTGVCCPTHTMCARSMFIFLVLFAWLSMKLFYETRNFFFTIYAI